MLECSVRSCARALCTLLAGLCAAIAFEAVRAPLPWMTGPLLAVSVLSMAGLPTALPAALRNAGQLTMGAMLGMSFTPDVIAAMGSIGWIICLSVAWSFAASWAMGTWLSHVLQKGPQGGEKASIKATAYFSSAVGGAAEMTLAADRNGGRADLVAAAQSVRILLAAIAVPMAMQYAGVVGQTDGMPHASIESPSGTVAMFVIAFLGAAALWLARRPSPWFLGPLLLVAACTGAGMPTTHVPAWISHIAQLVIACSLAIRFKRSFLATAPAWLGAVLAGSIGLIAAAAGTAWVVGAAMGFSVPTLILSFAPANITEMALTAHMLQLGVAVVVATQATRMVVVLMTAEIIFKITNRAGRQDDGPTTLMGQKENFTAN